MPRVPLEHVLRRELRTTAPQATASLFDAP